MNLGTHALNECITFLWKEKYSHGGQCQPHPHFLRQAWRHLYNPGALRYTLCRTLYNVLCGSCQHCLRLCPRVSYCPAESWVEQTHGRSAHHRKPRVSGQGSWEGCWACTGPHRDLPGAPSPPPSNLPPYFTGHTLSMDLPLA